MPLALYGTVFMVRACIVHGIACYAHVMRAAEPSPPLAREPFVSVLVPAYNESESIVPAIESLLSLSYSNYEIVVVDDGSKDDTYQKASQMAGDYGHCEVRVLRKANGGKWSALNLAFKSSSGDLVLCVDADSRLSEDALKLLVSKMVDPLVFAACGQVTIRNRRNILTNFQAAEYLLGNGSMRTALSFFGLVTVVPGPIGLYRRDVLEVIAKAPWNTQPEDRPGSVAGPLSEATFAEDFELSITALALGGRVVYEPRANAYTKGPEDITSLMSQRYRWIRGTIQVFHRYLRLMRTVARKRNRPLDLLMVIIYPLDVYAAPVLNFLFWGLLAIGAGSASSWDLLVSWIAAVMMLNVMAASVYIFVHDDRFSLLPYALFMDVYQSLLVNSAWVIAVVDELRGARMRWS
jgi:cellulose synthase/poly-beta-1,6-N-acetylglucosamine synthase-like glycosyltransferase